MKILYSFFLLLLGANCFGITDTLIPQMSETIQTEALYELLTPDERAFNNVIIEKGTGKDNKNPYYGYVYVTKNGSPANMKVSLLGIRSNINYGKKLYLIMNYYHPVSNVILESLVITILDYTNTNKDIYIKDAYLSTYLHLQENGCAVETGYGLDTTFNDNFYRILDYNYEKGILKLRFKMHFTMDKLDRNKIKNAGKPKEIVFDDGIVYAIERL